MLRYKETEEKARQAVWSEDQTWNSDFGPHQLVT